MQVRVSVKCVNDALERAGQAGVVMATDGKPEPKVVDVKWDIDGATESIKVVDLLELGSN